MFDRAGRSIAGRSLLEGLTLDSSGQECRRVTDRNPYWNPVATDVRLPTLRCAAHIAEHCMDLLTTAVVDITTLVATCHALKPMPSESEAVLQRKRRKSLQRELKRGTVAYIDTLARTRRGVVDDALLRKCRIAAEQQLPRALAQQEWLARIMGSEAGSLDGLAAARQDLWRLAHVAIYLSRGMATLRGSSALVDTKLAEVLAVRLRRRFRKALTAYARAALRTRATKGRLVIKARAAALAEIGPRGAAEAERLADVEAAAGPTLSVIRQGVVKPLLDLALDWERPDPGPR
jgi:hypothetical protein